MRLASPLKFLSLAAVLASGAAVAGDVPESARYTGFAVSYEFGGEGPVQAPGLSFGTLELSRPAHTDPTVVHVPLVSVLLAGKGEPEMAAVQLFSSVVRMLQSEGAGFEP